mmetsp:Transcript_1363/g.5347  ORF Transcript_1363/g.5347 Transcript_1363/m.5347 type:complete len:251 (+) Transcript_1363:5570-6322(+)
MLQTRRSRRRRRRRRWWRSPRARPRTAGSTMSRTRLRTTPRWPRRRRKPPRFEPDSPRPAPSTLRDPRRTVTKALRRTIYTSWTTRRTRGVARTTRENDAPGGNRRPTRRTRRCITTGGPLGCTPGVRATRCSDRFAARGRRRRFARRMPSWGDTRGTTGTGTGPPRRTRACTITGDWATYPVELAIEIDVIKCASYECYSVCPIARRAGSRSAAPSRTPPPAQSSRAFRAASPCPARRARTRPSWRALR